MKRKLHPSLEPNPDPVKRKHVAWLVKEAGGYCPCLIEQNEDTLCICVEASEHGRCVCKLFTPKE